MGRSVWTGLWPDSFCQKMSKLICVFCLVVILAAGSENDEEKNKVQDFELFDGGHLLNRRSADSDRNTRRRRKRLRTKKKNKNQKDKKKEKKKNKDKNNKPPTKNQEASKIKKRKSKGGKKCG